MIEVILAMTEEGGIGLNGGIPWSHNKDEMAFFRTKTMDSVMIVGRVTYPTVKHISDTRVIKVISKQTFTFEETLDAVLRDYPSKKIFIIGGAELYNYVFENYGHIIDRVHLSIMPDCFCDRFVKLDTTKYTVASSQNCGTFRHYVLENKKNLGETQYLALLRQIVQNPSNLTYGRNGVVKSGFVSNLAFNLEVGFPLLTTKKMFFRGIVEELIFFLKGETDSKLLEAKGVNIWKENTNRQFLDDHGKSDYREGDMGPMYGYQWRNFGKPYSEPSSKGVDQFLNIIEMIKFDPKSRRIFMTNYNPAQASEGVLYPCHSIVLHFFVDVETKSLDMFCYNRSSDLFLGLPFNIASSALMLTIVAYLTKLTPRMLHISLGDCHIYEQHIESVNQQLGRVPYKFPNLLICKEFSTVEELTFEHFNVIDYKSHSTIKAKMVS